MKIILLAIMIMFFTTSCGQNPEIILNENPEIITTEYINEPTTDETISPTENIGENIELTTAIRAQGGEPPLLTLINNILYVTNGHPPITFDRTDAEYVGEITNMCTRDRIPIENLSSNQYEDGIEIYKLNENDYVLAFKNTMYYTYTTLSPMDVSDDSIYRGFKFRTIRIEDSTYWFKFDYNFYNDYVYEEYDLSNAEYLDDIEYKLPDDYIPTENYTSNFCVEGSQVYRIDESTIVVKYEKDNKVLYEEGKIY